MLPAKYYKNNMFDEMFQDFFQGFPSRLRFFGGDQNDVMKADMKTDILEKDGQYILEMDLPGFGKEDVSAELKNGYLTVTAKKEETKEEKDEKGNYIRKERYCGTNSRSFFVGEHVKKEDITANFKDGILFLLVPKEEKPKLEESHCISID